VIDTSGFHVVVTTGVPAPTSELLWEVFFTSRGRGVSLPVHFPWMKNSENVFCLSMQAKDAAQEEKVIAALVVKVVNVSIERRVGLIGLVCVAEDWRGQGLSSQLMLEVTQFAKNMQLEALVLWTNKPNVYTSHNFVVDGQESFGYVQNREGRRAAVAFSSEAWPDSVAIDNQQGLPAFAVDGRLISTKSAKIVVLDSKDGNVTLMKWDGEKELVADLLECALPARWAINTLADEPLVEELRSRGFEVDLTPSTVRMVKNLQTTNMQVLKFIEFFDRV